MANVLDKETEIQILSLLVEGNSIRSTSRLTGCHKKTVTRVLVDFGEACRAFLDDKLRHLNLGHVEVDETWTFVQKKQARLTLEEKAMRHDIGDVFLWYGVDQTTRLIPAFLCGKRTGDNARRFMLDLAGRLTWPTAHESDRHAYEAGAFRRIIQISTDGFAAYPEAVDLAFGPYVRFGTIIKEYRNAKLQYDPSEMVGTKRTARRGLTDQDIYSICTSHIERCNLTVRTFM
jgi:hypothetical protein